MIAKGRRFRDQPTVNPGLAGFLRAYQLGGGYTPGPLFLFTALAGLAGTIGVLRRQASAAQRATATACLLTFLSAVAVLLASDLFEFSWRYQLPALVTLPPAGALGITVVIGYVAARPPARLPSQVPRPGRQRARVRDAQLSGSCQPGRGPNRADANHTTRASGTSSTTGSSAGT